MTPTNRIANAWMRTRTNLLERTFLARHAEFWLTSLDPVRSLSELRARVVGVIDETPDTKSFLLEPNAGWAGHRAGQYVWIEVEIDGVRVRRCYSICSAPGQRPLAITVKRVPGGRVSSWLHQHLRPGDVVHLGAAAGQFVLPDPIPAKLLLLSGGVGITPLMSMLRALATRNAVGDLVFVHYTRSWAEVIFGAELEQLAAAFPQLRLIVCADDDGRGPPGFAEEPFTTLVPDFAERSTFLCGPRTMMNRVDRLWIDAGAATLPIREAFTPAPRPTLAAHHRGEVQLTLTQSGRQVVGRGPGSLLEQLERAGERPQHGCRIGICHTCKCRKRSGAVENLVTGEVSMAPDEEIQLCISAPRSDLELEL